MSRSRMLGGASVATVAVVGLTAIWLGPQTERTWLTVCVGLAVATALQAVTGEPRDLTLALLFSVPPVLALVAEGSPAWLIGPLGAALLVAGELNAAVWESRGSEAVSAVDRRRLARMLQVAALGVAASLAVGALSRLPAPGGTSAFAVGAFALAALGALVFRPAH